MVEVERAESCRACDWLWLWLWPEPEPESCFSECTRSSTLRNARIPHSTQRPTLAPAPVSCECSDPDADSGDSAASEKACSECGMRCMKASPSSAPAANASIIRRRGANCAEFSTRIRKRTAFGALEMRPTEIRALAQIGKPEQCTSILYSLKCQEFQVVVACNLLKACLKHT